MKYFYIIILVLISINCFSQTIEEIKKSDKYYWGEGKGNSLEQADNNALKDLISQISVQIEHTMKSNWSEGNGNFKEFVESNVKTYSSATLDRAERKVEETENGTTVLRYITRTKMDEIFNDRKIKIIDYLKSAQNAEMDFRIGDALKYYYWSLALLRSHPDRNNIKYKLSGNDEQTLITALPEKIESMLSNLKINIDNITEQKDEKILTMNISYLGQPVQNLDYTYWIGDTWTNPTTAKNGLGYIELTGNTASSFNDIRIRTEYKYSANSRIDLELQSVLENTNTPFFKLSESKISIIKNIQETKLEVKSQNINLSDGTVEYEKTIEKIRNAINDNKYESVKSLFTDDGFKMYEKLITYGKAKVLPQKHDILFVKLNNEVVARSLPMTFTFTNNNKKFIEEVVFSFDSNKKISTISFSLGAKAISDISKMPDAFGTTENKYQIVQFMEGYKTAYCLKNIDYIENIFADNALIIVGHLLKQDKPIDNMYGSLGDNVKYVKLKKSEYIENLKRVFNSSEFVNIQFDENNVKKINGKKIYGIQIAQNYYSSSYADKGFLFLMFDLEDDKNPKIYVRTWQPQKNPDGSIFGLSDFTIE